MKAEMTVAERQASVYVAAGPFGPARIGVAVDPRKRLRELQVGSPVKLELALARPYANRLDADAVVEELYRRFAARRAHGRWYQLSVADVRSALANPATLAAPANAAAARAAAAAEAAAREARLARRRGRSSRARTEKELDYQLRRRRERQAKQRRAARLIGQGMTQTDAAAAVGVTPRTLRNWKHMPAFRRELERQRERAARTRAPTAHSKARPRRDAEHKRRDRARRRGPAPHEHDPPPPPPGRPQTIAEAGERPVSSLRHVDGVPLWGDSDGWPRTPQEHAERDAYYTARRDRSPADRIDYNTVVQFGGQTPAEKRAVRLERMRSRDGTRHA